MIRTDRCRAAGPIGGVDLRWSGQHRHQGGTVQVDRPARLAAVDLAGTARPRA